MDREQTLVITLSGTRAARQVAKELEARGLHAVQVLEEIACVTGRAAPDAVPELRRVEGVADIAFDTPIQLDDPANGSTW